MTHVLVHVRLMHPLRLLIHVPFSSFFIALTDVNVLMSLPTHLTNNASQLPIFCSSNALLFYLGRIDVIPGFSLLELACSLLLDDSSTFSQVLTLYNPYDFAVRYKGTSLRSAEPSW